jgi:hypothetical protein
MAKQYWGGKSEYIDKAHDISSEIVIAVAMVWDTRISVTPSVWHDNVVIIF